MGVLERKRITESPPVRLPAGPGPRLRAVAGAVAFAVAVGCTGADTDPTPRFPPGDYTSLEAPVATAPLVGTNYTHHSFAGCTWDGGGILQTYRHAGVAEEVHEQMRRMRRAGVGSLRLIVWHMRDVPRQRWGVVPSRGGRLPEPFRGNLVAYLTEVRRFGFERLTISFSPQWSNNPREDNWAPARFEENWSFIRDVRALALEHGPDDLRFDLLNEGAASDHSPGERRTRVMAYVRRMWERYADTFGVEDVTVSVIAPRTPWDRGRRLENLLDTLTVGGAPPPPWIELHLNYDPGGVAWGLHYADSVLSARGLDQPLTIGETSYDDAAVADAVRAFVARSDRPVREVLQWFKRAGAECEVSPPYEVDAYRTLETEGSPDHRGASASGNSSASRARASATTSGSGGSSSSPEPSGSGVSPELLMR